MLCVLNLFFGRMKYCGLVYCYVFFCLCGFVV